MEALRRLSCRLVVLYALPIAPLAIAQPASANPLPHTVVAFSGDPAPGWDGVLSDFHSPGMRKDGEIVFVAEVRKDGFFQGRGLFRADGEQLNRVVAEGDSSPDGNGNVGSLATDRPFLNEIGDVAFLNVQENTFGGFSDSYTLFFAGEGDAEPLSVVLRSYDFIPDETGARLYPPFSPVAFNNDGEIAFVGVREDDLRGIWRANGHTKEIETIATEGDRLPSDDGYLWVNLSITIPPTMNEAGEVAFFSGGYLDVGKTIVGLFRGDDASGLTPIVRTGDPIPSGSGVFSGLSVASLAHVNDNSQVAFIGFLENTSGGFADDVGIFRSSGGSLEELVREGETAPDGNGRFLFNPIANPMTFNNLGDVLFSVDLTAAANGASTGLFLAGDSGVEQVARLNQEAPGGGTFAEITSVFALNDSRQVVFLAFVDDGGSSLVQGLFTYDDGKLESLVREGDFLPGYGTVTGVTDTGLGSGLSSEQGFFTNSGQVAYRFSVTGGRGIAIAEVPCSGDSELDLSGFSVFGPESYRACDTLTVGNLAVENGGHLSLRAGNSVVFFDGFRVAEGGQLSVRAGGS